MTWTFLLWLLSFVFFAALLGIDMYLLICLSDLENDFINPHDATSRINVWVFPEMALHGLLTACYLVTGRWLMWLLNMPLLLWHARLSVAGELEEVTWFWYVRKEYRMDVTEVFSQLAYEKKHRLLKLFIYILLFIIVIYRWIEAAVRMFSES
eukprot:jgi/Mesen1/6092/ME000031S05365